MNVYMYTRRSTAFPSFLPYIYIQLTSERTSYIHTARNIGSTYTYIGRARQDFLQLSISDVSVSHREREGERRTNEKSWEPGDKRRGTPLYIYI